MFMFWTVHLIPVILCFYNLSVVTCLKFNAASVSDLALITKEGKELWESLGEKVNLPHYGSCWKNAIHNLQQGCKFLSEDVQSGLALRFTDCFLQMSGYEPLTCSHARDVCLRSLSDRAFNAYTEFYTHTQSICYFLQSQVWHEEAQKTIDKLSDTSLIVTAQLEEAGRVQEKILNQQKESLLLQHYLMDNGKTIASALKLSQEKISNIMRDFQDSATEQREVLFELFEKLSLLRSWVVGEVSWINSILFYMASMVIGYLFTSVSSTRQARIYILLSLTLNYLIERFIYAHADQNNNYYLGENVNMWIWFSRKIFVIISAVVLLYSAVVYCDYNIMNHKLLLEIKNQNKKILNIFETNSLNNRHINNDNIFKDHNEPEVHDVTHERHFSCYSARNSFHKNFTPSPVCVFDKEKENPSCKSSKRKSNINVDDIDSASIATEKSGALTFERRERPYNLRSSGKSTK